MAPKKSQPRLIAHCKQNVHEICVGGLSLLIGHLLSSVSADSPGRGRRGQGWLHQYLAIRKESRRGLFYCAVWLLGLPLLFGLSRRCAVCTLRTSCSPSLSISTSTGCLERCHPNPLSLQPRRFVPRPECCYVIIPEGVFVSTHDFYDGLLLVCNVDKLFCINLSQGRSCRATCRRSRACRSGSHG